VEEFLVISASASRAELERFVEQNPGLTITCTLSADHSYPHREQCVANGVITADNCFDHQAIIDMVLHVGAWKHCVRTQSTTHIFDDRLILRQDFTEAITPLVQQDDFDLIVWSVDTASPTQIRYSPGVIGRLLYDQTDSALGELHFRNDTTPAQPLQLLQCGYPLGYTLSPRGAETLLARCLPFSSLPVRYFDEADNVWANTWHFIEMARHYPSLRAFITQPLLGVFPYDVRRKDDTGHFWRAFTYLCARHSRCIFDGGALPGRAA